MFFKYTCNVGSFGKYGLWFTFGSCISIFFLFKPSFYKFVQVTFLVMLDKIILTSLEQNKFGFLYTKLHINVYLNPLFDRYVQQLPFAFKTLVLAYLFAIIQTFVWINLKKNVLKKVIFISTLLIKTI